LDNKIGRFWWQTNSADFCMTDDRFLLADFIGRRNWPTLSFVWLLLYVCFRGRQTPPMRTASATGVQAVTGGRRHPSRARRPTSSRTRTTARGKRAVLTASRANCFPPRTCCSTSSTGLRTRFPAQATSTKPAKSPSKLT